MVDLYMDDHVSYEKKTIAWRVKFCVLTKLKLFSKISVCIMQTSRWEIQAHGSW